MNLVYRSTRNREETASASEAILKGLTNDGGLFVPDSIPKLQVSVEDLKEMTYQDIAYAVMKEFHRFYRGRVKNLYCQCL